MRNKRAALKSMRKLLKKYDFAPEKLVTDELSSYAAASLLRITKHLSVVDGATIEPRIRVNRPVNESTKCKVSKSAGSAQVAATSQRRAHAIGRLPTQYRSWAEEFMPRIIGTLLCVIILAVPTMEVSRAGGTAADYEMANRYQQSAEQGNAAAQFYLGALHSAGVGRPQSDVEAFRWFLRAAEQGHSEAQLILSALYTIGRGTARSDTNAYRWASIVAVSAKIEETRAGAQQLLDVLVQRMSEEDIVEAKKTIDLQQTPTDQTQAAELGKNLSDDRRMTPSPADIDRRVQSLDEAITRNPRDAEAYYRRGQIHAQKGEWALANEDFVQAGRLNPNDAEALNNSCFTGAVIGNLNPALQECNEALRLRPNYADALDSRGLISLKLGQYDRALADYDAALRAKPKLASALYGRGKAKLMKGNFKGGTADIQAAITINPNIPEEFARYGLP